MQFPLNRAVIWFIETEVPLPPLSSHDKTLYIRAILRHDVGWFDTDENSVGTLVTNLEEDSAKVRIDNATQCTPLE